jgi:multiple sugar transport system permease protein
MPVLSKRLNTTNMIILIALVAGAALMLTPMLYMATTAFQGHAYIQRVPPELLPSNPTVENFQVAFSSRNFGQAFLNSAVVAVATSFLVTLLASMMAYAFARFEFFGKRFLYYALLIMLMVPATMLIIPQFIVAASLNLTNSLPGLTLVYVAGALAWNTFLLRGFFEGLPRELEESALIDGANHFVIFSRILIPLSTPAVSTVAIFSFLGAWDELILALTMITDAGKRTLPVAIANFRGVHATDWGLIFAASLTAVIPTILLFVFFQRYFVQGLTSGAVKS